MQDTMSSSGQDVLIHYKQSYVTRVGDMEFTSFMVALPYPHLGVQGIPVCLLCPRRFSP